MLFKEMIDVYIKNNIKHENTDCRFTDLNQVAR
jgi:hypothetical protein